MSTRLFPTDNFSFFPVIFDYWAKVIVRFGRMASTIFSFISFASRKCWTSWPQIGLDTLKVEMVVGRSLFFLSNWGRCQDTPIPVVKRKQKRECKWEEGRLKETAGIIPKLDWKKVVKCFRSRTQLLKNFVVAGTWASGKNNGMGTDIAHQG